MPDFPNPFSGNVQRKMTKSELLRALRLNLAAEEEAVHLYLSHADATDDPLAKKVLIDIAGEEREHIGEFQRLINILDPEEETYLSTGFGEVDEMAEELGRKAGEASSGGEESDEDVPSVGDMKE